MRQYFHHLISHTYVNQSRHEKCSIDITQQMRAEQTTADFSFDEHAEERATQHQQATQQQQQRRRQRRDDDGLLLLLLTCCCCVTLL